MVAAFNAGSPLARADEFDRPLEIANDTGAIDAEACERRATVSLAGIELASATDLLRRGWPHMHGNAEAPNLPIPANDGPDHPSFHAPEGDSGPTTLPTDLFLTLGHRRVGILPNGRSVEWSGNDRPFHSQGLDSAANALTGPLYRTTGRSYLAALRDEAKPYVIEDLGQAALRRYLEVREAERLGADPTRAAKSAGLLYLVVQMKVQSFPRVIQNAQIYRAPSRRSHLWDFRPIGIAQTGKKFSSILPHWDGFGFSTEAHTSDHIYLLFHPRVAAFHQGFNLWDGMIAGTDQNVGTEGFLENLANELLRSASALAKPNVRWRDARDAPEFFLPAPIPLHDLVGIAAGEHSERVIRALRRRTGISLEEARAMVYSGYNIEPRATVVRTMAPISFHQDTTPFDLYALVDPQSGAEFWRSSIPRDLQKLDFTKNIEIREVSYWLGLWGSKIRVLLADGATVEGTVNSFCYEGIPMVIRSSVASRQAYYFAKLILRAENGSYQYAYLEPEARLPKMKPGGERRAVTIDVLSYQPNRHRGAGDARLPITRAILDSTDFLEHLQDILISESSQRNLRQVVELSFDE